MQREQAIVREIGSMVSIVVCCHGANLCAHAARDFQSKQYIQPITNLKSRMSSNTTVTSKKTLHKKIAFTAQIRVM